MAPPVNEVTGVMNEDIKLECRGFESFRETTNKWYKNGVELKNNEELPASKAKYITDEHTCAMRNSLTNL